ncbi:amidohydrolase 2 [Artomyces pyxidatus]|uniref:Amidohydrolase 2 n=1 Tax=Artomyces pyxidatus TaxID=48021 RepID=A0ACB8T461_9AGAM|nr:amidohydrolase 2 [Artomyces pyxidatus]
MSHSETLADVCRRYPAIDNHAHPLLTAAHRASVSFDSLVTEAEGPAVADSANTLACFAATPALAALYECSPEWEAVKATRAALPYDELCRRCFKGARLHCMLLDDGLPGVKEMAEGLRWHDQFARSRTKRIVRVETVAQELLQELFVQHAEAELVSFELLSAAFEERLAAVAADEDVVGFKSVVCYRTGLAVSPSTPESAVRDALAAVQARWRRDPTAAIRIQDKALNDYVVCATLRLASASGKPVQFHTGLGDPDITLALASPAHLQPAIRAFPRAPIVLLHASYPYTRDAGYLASVYANVFLDFGEIFPAVSPGGQRDAVRQMLELTPTNKILWSSDGHWWPETFYLGSVQAREALLEVLSEYVRRPGLTEAQAVQIAKNALFHNANRVYKLGLEPEFQPEQK